MHNVLVSSYGGTVYNIGMQQTAGGLKKEFVSIHGLQNLLYDDRQFI